jgi:molybdenum cofactor cytidylyltransferase
MATPPPALGIVLLAAGASTRLGQPKQLLDVHGEPLLERMVRQALPLSCPVVVVLGAYQAQVAAALEGLPVALVHNPHWAAGMGTSVRLGLRTLLAQHPDLPGCLFCVSDQIFLDTSLLRQYLETFRTSGFRENTLLAARYASGAVGVPVLFGKNWMPALLQLDDAAGANRILKQHPLAVTHLPFPQGDFDIDYPEDWEKWKNQDF